MVVDECVHAIQSILAWKGKLATAEVSPKEGSRQIAYLDLVEQVPKVPSSLRDWALVKRYLADDLPSLTDSLFRAWRDHPAAHQAANINTFLRLYELAQVRPRNDHVDPLPQDWQPRDEEVDLLWDDCLAVAYAALYATLVKISSELLRRCAQGDADAISGLLETGVLDSLHILEAAERNVTGSPLGATRSDLQGLVSLALLDRLRSYRVIPIQRHIHAGEYKRLGEQIEAAAKQRQATISQREAELLALIVLLTAEESSRSAVTLWIVAAGRAGGVAQLRVATLQGTYEPEQLNRTDAHGRYDLVELAPWSRYSPDEMDNLNSIARAFSRWMIEDHNSKFVPDQRYRIILNPPGECPAEESSIKDTRPSGTSIGLGFALTIYATVSGAYIQPSAATGAVENDEKLTLVRVNEVPDKLNKIDAYNRQVAHQPDQQIKALWLPADNMDYNVVAMAKQLGIALNTYVPGGKPLLRPQSLSELLQPGILCDAFLGYAKAVLAHGAGTPLQHDPTGGPASDPPSYQRLADQVIDNILSQGHDRGEASQVKSRAFLLSSPTRLGPSAVAGVTTYIASRLAQARVDWAEALGRRGHTHARPPVPVVMSYGDVQEANTFEQAVLRKVAGSDGEGALSLHTRNAWRTLDGEFAVIVYGGDDLVRRFIGPSDQRQGFLAEVSGKGGETAGRHYLVLVAKSIEQMHRWAEELQAADETIDPAPALWYGN